MSKKQGSLTNSKYLHRKDSPSWSFQSLHKCPSQNAMVIMEVVGIKVRGDYPRMANYIFCAEESALYSQNQDVSY